MNMLALICTSHKRVCLDMHCFCSFDNWLCNLISENWQLTLVLSPFSVTSSQMLASISYGIKLLVFPFNFVSAAALMAQLVLLIFLCLKVSSYVLCVHPHVK